MKVYFSSEQETKYFIYLGVLSKLENFCINCLIYFFVLND